MVAYQKKAAQKINITKLNLNFCNLFPVSDFRLSVISTLCVSWFCIRLFSQLAIIDTYNEYLVRWITLNGQKMLRTVLGSKMRFVANLINRILDNCSLKSDYYFQQFSQINLAVIEGQFFFEFAFLSSSHNPLTVTVTHSFGYLLGQVIRPYNMWKPLWNSENVKKTTCTLFFKSRQIYGEFTAPINRCKGDQAYGEWQNRGY